MPGGAGASQPRVAVTVVHLPPVVVREHLVRLGEFLELGLGLWIVRVAIRVVLHREAAVRAFDLVRVGGSLDAEGFVVVARGGHAALRSR